MRSPAQSPPDPPSSKTARALVVAWVLLGFWLRLTGLDVHSLWFDEAGTTLVANSPDPLALLRGDHHPPLSFLAYRAWLRCFGEDDATLRLLPASLSCISLVLFAWLARLWVQPRAWGFAAALYAVAPFHVWHAQEVRMYAFLEVGTIVCLCGLASFLLRPSVWAACLLGAGQSIALGSHYMGALLIPTALGIVVLAAKLGRLRARGVWIAAGAVLLGALIWAPWIGSALPAQMGTSWGYTGKMGLRDLIELPVRQILTTLSAIPSAWQPVGIALGLCILLGFALFAFDAVRRFRAESVWAGSSFFIPVATAFLASLLGPPNFTPRYLTVASPGTALLLSIGLGSIGWRSVRLGLMAAVVAGCLALSLLHRQHNLREDFKSACADVEARWQAGDLVVCTTGTPEPFSRSPLLHYLRYRPDIVGSIVSSSELRAFLGRPPAAEETAKRIHVVYRDAGYSRAEMEFLHARLDLVMQTETRYRIQYALFALPANAR